MAAGCLSSKEIYDYDESIIPGCVFWSGVMAMMTDSRNKLTAATVTADKKARFENSNFYGDFKKKMHA